MFITPLLLTILVTLISGIFSKSVELTFELPDSAVECFYQEIEKNTSASLEYQVHNSLVIFNISSRYHESNLHSRYLQTYSTAMI